MALKIIKKAQTLPKGGDRFVWNEFNATRPAQKFVRILRFDKPAKPVLR